MIPELGHFALILALALALIQAILPWLKDSRLAGLTENTRAKYCSLTLAKSIASGHFFFISFAFACLAYAFISNDFSVAYVAANSNTHLPLAYRVGALWGAHEGSLLLWLFILSLWMVGAALCSNNLPPLFTLRVLSILGIISASFLLFLLLTSNPFQRLLPQVPTEGADLNPLLQDPGLVGHPPMLYMGYVGFSVAFAFALAALWSGKMDAAWSRWTRPWTLAAWCFLTIGITLGSWWAYRELGWGGWWFWDPVENASLLPWLSGTALLHSLIVTEKREAFKSWTALLAIITFSLSLMGTFLVRSGILISVHAFANDPARGGFLLQLLAIVIGGSLLLYTARASSLKSTAGFAVISRESLLLSNNLLLISLTATILLGTLYPLILDALELGKISVGPPYFNTVLLPLMIPILFFMGVTPFCFWYQTDKYLLTKQLLYPFLLALTLSTTLLFVYTQQLSFLVWLGLFLAFWIILATLLSLSTQQKKWTQQRWGMVFAHIGIAICVIGITLTTHYQLARYVRMQPGDEVAISDYHIEFLGTKSLQGPNYTGTKGEFLIKKNTTIINLLEAEKRLYTAEQTEMTESAIDVGLTRDIYIALGDPLQNNAWGVRFYYKPFIRFIWFGGVLMAIGGILAIARKNKS